jgi:hypothetical protein
MSGGAQLVLRQLRFTYWWNRARARVLITVIAIVVVASVVSVYTSNRLPKAIMVAAVASAAPVALFLGTRRPSG